MCFLGNNTEGLGPEKTDSPGCVIQLQCFWPSWRDVKDAVLEIAEVGGSNAGAAVAEASKILGLENALVMFYSVVHVVYIDFSM